MTLPPSPLRLGTRASPLAMAQAHMVRDALLAAHRWPEEAVTITAMTASGDKILDRSLADIGGKALWTKELDRALIDKTIDFAVHSMKDVETIRPPEIEIAAMLERADVRDRLVGADSIDALPKGATIGTNSPRRTAQLGAIRPDLKITLFRGNVATRLEKLARGDAGATLLAAAGLDRLGLTTTGTPIPIEVMLPAAAQGAIGIEARTGDTVVSEVLSAISHEPTMRCVLTERAFLSGLSAGCHSPVAAYAFLFEDAIAFRAQLLSADGTEEIAVNQRLTHPNEAFTLALDMLAGAPPSIRKLFAI